MKNLLSAKETASILFLLTFAGVVIGAGDFVIKYFDPSFTDTQKGFAAFFGWILVVIFGLINFILWKGLWKK